MDLLTLIIVILVLLWLFGYFGRGRWYGGRGTTVSRPAFTGDWINTLLIIVVILVVLRLLGII